MFLLEHIFDTIAPYDCLRCEAEGRLICAACWGEAWPDLPEQPTLGPFLRVWVATVYDGMARELVRHMKIDCQRQACSLIAQALDESAPAFGDAVVTSVPTAPPRVRERGFDHGRLIATEFARRRGLNYQQLMIRHGRAKQAGASRQARAAQIKGSYEVRVTLPSKAILIIDDVMTTGATLQEVAHVLKAAGANDLSALLFAKTI